MVLEFGLLHLAGEWCHLLRKEILVEALSRLGEVSVWSRVREEGTLEGRRIPWPRMRLVHRGFNAEEEVGMEVTDSTKGRSEVLEHFVLAGSSSTQNAIK